MTSTDIVVFSWEQIDLRRNVLESLWKEHNSNFQNNPLYDQILSLWDEVFSSLNEIQNVLFKMKNNTNITNLHVSQTNQIMKLLREKIITLKAYFWLYSTLESIYSLNQKAQAALAMLMSLPNTHIITKIRAQNDILNNNMNFIDQNIELFKYLYQFDSKLERMMISVCFNNLTSMIYEINDLLNSKWLDNLDSSLLSFWVGKDADEFRVKLLQQIW